MTTAPVVWYSEAMNTATRTDNGNGTYAYAIDGETVYAASKTFYTHFAVTEMTTHEAYGEGYQQAGSFHKSAQAAAKGHPSIAKRYVRSIRVVEL